MRLEMAQTEGAAKDSKPFKVLQRLAMLCLPINDVMAHGAPVSQGHSCLPKNIEQGATFEKPRHAVECQ